MPDLDLISPFKNLNESDTSCQLAEASYDQKPTDALDFSLNHTRDRIDSEDFILPLNLTYPKDWDVMLQELSVSKPHLSDDALPRRKSSLILTTDPTLNQLEVC